MRLYLDDDLASAQLVQILTKAGHDVRIPKDEGMEGKADALHFAHAIGHHRVVLSRNYTDFENLHLVVMAAQGHHPGILLVRRDNNPRRNLRPRDIARALSKIVAAGVPIADRCQPLNPSKWGGRRHPVDFALVARLSAL